MSSQDRKLDEESLNELNRLKEIPKEKQTKVDNLFFDVAVSFKEGQPMVYRIIWVCFPERRLRLVRHRKVKEDFGLYAINFVTKFEMNKIKLVIGGNCTRL